MGSPVSFGAREDVLSMETSVSAAPSPARRILRGVLVVVPALAFVGLLSFGLQRASGPPGVGDEAPAFEAERLAGDGTLALADLEGRPLVLNFWASWCLPCEDEAPMLKAAHERYGDRVAFVGVDINDARSDALAFVDRYGLTYPNVRDEEGRIKADYGLTGQPETFFISAQGLIVEHLPGAIPSEDRLFEVIEGLVAKRG